MHSAERFGRCMLHPHSFSHPTSATVVPPSRSNVSPSHVHACHPTQGLAALKKSWLPMDTVRVIDFICWGILIAWSPRAA